MVRLLTILCVIGTTISIRAQGPLDEAVELVWKTQFDLELHAWLTAPKSSSADLDTRTPPN